MTSRAHVLSALAGMALAGTMAIARSPVQRPADPPRYHEAIAGTLVGFEMIRVPGGEASVPDGAATRTVAVAPFYLGITEVTWDLYDIFALRLDRGAEVGTADAMARPSNPYGAPDYGWGHAGFPAISVTRAAAEAFCSWLSLKTGKAYRLPTEAEWARAAALAGAAPPPKLDAIAWHRGNSGARVHAVGSRTADALGVFDLFGNAGEWVRPADGALVLRGGSFRDPAASVGAAARAVQDPSWNETDPQLPKSTWWLSDAPFAGFRIARAAGDPASVTLTRGGRGHDR